MSNLVHKFNWNKSTRFNKDGWREAQCPMCGRWVWVASWPDDLRWRYSTHRNGPEGTPECMGSQELLPVEKKEGRA